MGTLVMMSHSCGDEGWGGVTLSCKARINARNHNECPRTLLLTLMGECAPPGSPVWKEALPGAPASPPAVERSFLSGPACC